MCAKKPDPDVAIRLIEAAARVLAEEGPAAVSARRLANEVGASTMVVYTHFGGMDHVLGHVRREGFRRFAEALAGPRITDDPVADWMSQAWAYRRFALDEPHLYRAMFGSEIGVTAHDTAEDAEAALATFALLLDRIERCGTSGRWAVDDVALAGEMCWALVHGFAQIELSGFFADVGRDPTAAHAQAMRRVALGYGDDPDEVDASLERARRRAARAGLL
ncbi:TetR/AcrR family transcriptional regulator [Actinomarinicola tropica]|nr:TetR/AcrR family transcriptional regulator [Actinomarinicola tropica]